MTYTADEGLLADTSKVILFYVNNNEVIMNQKYIL